VLTALLLVLLILWLLGYLQIGDVAFLRMPVATVAGRQITVLDLLVAISVIWVIAALRGPIALAAFVLLILLGLSIFGLVAIEGIPLTSLVVLVAIVGLLVHIVTRRPGR
jgi:hypothetical protein